MSFVAGMEDVLSVYELPYEDAYPQVCLDEKLVTLHRDVVDPLPVQPGRVERVDYEYERIGTANLFVMLEPRTGYRHVVVTKHPQTLRSGNDHSMNTHFIEVHRTFKYRMYQNKKAEKRLFQTIDIAGIIWNHCVALHWYLADPVTGTSEPMPGFPELYAINNPDGLAVRYDVHIDPPPNDITPPILNRAGR